MDFRISSTSEFSAHSAPPPQLTWGLGPSAGTRGLASFLLPCEPLLSALRGPLSLTAVVTLSHHTRGHGTRPLPEYPPPHPCVYQRPAPGG